VAKQLSRRIAAAVAAVDTPAFVCDHARLDSSVRAVRAMLEPLACRFLYSMKALPLGPVLRALAGRVDGVSASSPFEARLARDVLGESGAIHFTSPGVRPADVPYLAATCDYIACNSLHQYRLLRQGRRASLGLRVNVGIDFVGDPRYAPSRPNSKLGIPLDAVHQMLRSGEDLSGVAGIHIHHNSESRNWGELARAVALTMDRLGSSLLPVVQWVNLGGGYLFSQVTGLRELASVLERLRERFGVELFMEPGAAVAGDAGFFVASVVDLFESGGVLVAVLDTSINHQPNVFSYQYSPPVLTASRQGTHPHLLAGCSCLPGDVFGIYRFPGPLRVGSRVVFPSAGAYTLAKASMFNGIALPTVYDFWPDGRLELVSRFGFEQFAGIYAGASADYAPAPAMHA
jgi:carboxynorspermidine decarboxylase